MILQALQGLLSSRTSEQFSTEISTATPLISLVYLSQRGNEEAFSLLYDRIAPTLLKYVAARLPGYDAEDIASDVFVKIWEKLDQFSGDSDNEFRSWSYTIAQRTIVDYYRSKKDTTTLDDALHISSTILTDSPEESTQLGFTTASIKNAVHLLSDDIQELLTLRYFQGFSHSEIALLTGKTETSVRVSIHRGLQSLKKDLEHLL